MGRPLITLVVRRQDPLLAVHLFDRSDCLVTGTELHEAESLAHACAFFSHDLDGRRKTGVLWLH